MERHYTIGTGTDVICVRCAYQRTMGLAVRVLECTGDPDRPYEAFGMLTACLPDQPTGGPMRAWVKTYSENAPWAKQLLDRMGARPLGKQAVSGYATLPLYEFDEESLSDAPEEWKEYGEGM